MLGKLIVCVDGCKILGGMPINQAVLQSYRNQPDHVDDINDIADLPEPDINKIVFDKLIADVIDMSVGDLSMQGGGFVCLLDAGQALLIPPSYVLFEFSQKFNTTVIVQGVAPYHLESTYTRETTDLVKT